MAAMAQLSCPSLAAHYCLIFTSPHTTSISFRLGNNTFPSSQCSKITKPLNFDLQTKLHVPCAGGGGDVGGIGWGNGGGNGGRGEWSGGGGDSDESRSSGDGFGPIGALINGWRSRVVLIHNSLSKFSWKRLWASARVFLETWCPGLILVSMSSTLCSRLLLLGLF
ncbi:UNVERIFIED_CONTAM: hypothetical protein Slati_3842000 [Sesamum latifolium]|uniref:Uncharacterized protein n=1 Tax=Sesamum latifolium TaxID=2727402 RepID=A0AAW2TNS5_9LAMI